MSKTIQAAALPPAVPIDGASSAEKQARKARRLSYLLLMPGVVWMTLFLVLPLVMIVYVSFWTQTTFAVQPILTSASWERFLTNPTYLDATWTTVRIWLLVLVSTFVVMLNETAMSVALIGA